MKEIIGLKEVMCEIIFDSGKKYDMTVPGLFYAEVRNEFPNKLENFIKNVKIENENTDDEVASIQRKQLTIFKSDDGKRAIQVGENVLVNNNLGEVFDWKEFKEQVDKSIRTYLEITNDEFSISDISVKFLVGCDIKDDSFDNFFKFKLSVPSESKNYNKPASFRCKFDYEIGDSKLITIFRSINRKGRKDYFLELVFDLVSKDSQTIDTNEWLDRAYSNIIGYYNDAIKN